jgi:hypothetical protein
MKYYCQVCDKLIPEGRVKLGYTTRCVEHSSTFKYVGFVASLGKTDYDISIVKDRDTATHMEDLRTRRTK